MEYSWANMPKTKLEPRWMGWAENKVIAVVVNSLLGAGVAAVWVMVIAWGL